MGLVNFPEMLTLELVNTFVRDSNEDILYNPEKEETRNKDYCLFYYIDRIGNKVYAYNRHLLTADILNIYNYKCAYGCLMFFSNDDKYFIDPRYSKEDNTKGSGVLEDTRGAPTSAPKCASGERSVSKLIEKTLTNKAWYKPINNIIYVKAQ